MTTPPGTWVSDEPATAVGRPPRGLGRRELHGPWALRVYLSSLEEPCTSDPWAARFRRTAIPRPS